ncbi:perlucin-like protein [Mizuhopecten yessoensis]|uniref:Perlucin-like protein n=1 Tax=Mizuhopecten yessoensis TaxID=6573 RepID=A0A210QJ78_MIZYE|nr:perlucin-like protein [Mizuhopecten yessoensis]OWF48835.1 Perlucin-like protein [Mizuhopecten yessoensis]
MRTTIEMGQLHIFQIAIILVIPYTDALQCRDGWTGFEGSCYYLSHGVATWAEAGAVCKMLGSNLAMIETAAELTFLKSELRHIHQHDADKMQYWIDGADLEVENVWRWTQTEQIVSFTEWAPGEPNAGENDNCMNLWGKSGFRYADNDCEEHYHYVCQIRDPEGGELVG